MWARIDLAALRRNLGAIRAHVGSRVRVMGVIKADAYGHGAVPVARALAEAGVDFLGVGNAEEGTQVRRCGFGGRILVLGTVVESEIDVAIAHRLDLAVHDREMVGVLWARARRAGRVLRVHVKVDTGMTRLGSPVKDAPVLIDRIDGCPELELAGIFTHYSCATNPRDPFTLLQITRFKRFLRRLRERRRRVLPLVHAASTGGLAFFPGGLFDMVRPGIGLFGINPSSVDLGIDLEPVLSLHSQIAHLKEVPPGTPVGYDRTWTAARPTRLAVIPVGYDDGYPIAFSNRAHVLVRGHRAPVVGRVSMDYLTADVTDVAGITRSDTVTLIGRCGRSTVQSEDLARLANAETSPYEITCRLGSRVHRHFFGSITRRMAIT